MKTMHAFTDARVAHAAARALPAAELPALRAGRRRDHHQLREPARRRSSDYLEVDAAQAAS